MSLRAPDAARTGPRHRAAGWLPWWVAPSPSLIWRLPLLIALVALGAWYVFRGLVKMAFIFTAGELTSFLLAPILLPLAALPAYCFYFALRALPGVWRSPTTTDGRKVLATAAALPAAWLVAAFVDLLEILAILRLDIRLPRIPLDPF
jgi:hypothetical protein